MEHELLDFIHHLSAHQQRSQNTISAYRADLSHLARYLKGQSRGEVVDWGQVTPEMLHGYQEHLRTQTLAMSTIARKMAAIRSFFRFLVAAALRSDNPARELDTPAVQRRSTHPLRAEEIDRLCRAPEPALTPKAMRDRALLELLCTVGLRASELAQLRLEDLDLEQAKLIADAQGSRVREIELSPDTICSQTAYLEGGRPHLVKNPDERAYFLNYRGQALTRQGIWLTIKTYAHMVGLADKITPTALRRSLMTHLLADGTAPQEVQQLMGHASVVTTRAYGQ